MSGGALTREAIVRGLTEERLAKLWDIVENGFELKPETVKELLAEVTRLRSSTGADERVREAAERYIAAWDAKDAADCAEPEPYLPLVQQRGREKARALADLRASLSVVPATGETSDG